MYIAMFNGWYFFWLAFWTAVTAGLYLFLRKKSPTTQKIVLFSLLVFGLLMHFAKIYYPPYSVDEARKLRDSWFVNICGANIALFPLLFLSRSNRCKDYMFYIGVISGLISLFYPQEPLAKANQLGEQLDILRYYYHHWMILGVPLLTVLLGLHAPSYKRILWAPTGLLMLMLFIILNQIFMSELGFIPLRDRENFLGIDYKNTSYIWGPGQNDAIGKFLARFTPEFFRKVPVGKYAGQIKYWPWFWLIFPAYILVTPMAFLIAMIFDRKSFVADLKSLHQQLNNKLHPAKTHLP